MTPSELIAAFRREPETGSLGERRARLLRFLAENVCKARINETHFLDELQSPIVIPRHIATVFDFKEWLALLAEEMEK